MGSAEHITYIAETDFRGKRTKFGIKDEDRARHVYVIGKTGMGKSTLLENMAIQDIQNGHGVAFMDPHGSTAEKLLDYIPESRLADVVYFAPFDLDNPISFNVMEDVGADQRHLVVSGLMSAFKKLFGEESFSDRMQYILQNTLLALLEYPGSTMLGINRMLTDKNYRAKVVANVTDASVKAYWTQEFANYTERFAAEATPAIQNKVGQFTSNPLIRNIIGQPKSSLNFRRIMDERKILIINLSKGRMGESNANLIGSMLITKIYLAAMSRANITEGERRVAPPFYFYVDEFQSFANESFANILSEARKYKLSLTIAHQYVEQMSEEVRAAVFGNVGTVISFRIGPFDAEIFEKMFSPTFLKEDMVNLGFAQIYLTMMINGVGSQPFSALTLPPIPAPAVTLRDQVIASTRRVYARPRAAVEAEIVSWMQLDKPSPPAPKAAGRPAPTRPPINAAPPPPKPPEREVVTPEKVTNTPEPERVVSLNSLKKALSAVLPAKASGKNSAALREALAAVKPKIPNPPVPAPSHKPEVSEAALRKILDQ
jgi:energy-coupling factor transporter ATP-binding protein EcfA2